MNRLRVATLAIAAAHRVIGFLSIKPGSPATSAQNEASERYK